MLNRTENIEGFHLKVSGIEKEIYGEFERTQEQEIVEFMQQHFAEAMRQQSGIKFDNKVMWSKIEARVDEWFSGICAEWHVELEVVKRAREAINHRLRDHLIKTIRVFLRANATRSQS